MNCKILLIYLLPTPFQAFQRSLLSIQLYSFRAQLYFCYLPKSSSTYCIIKNFICCSNITFITS